MNSEDIKATHSMQDVLNRYGLIPNRAKFIQCPSRRQRAINEDLQGFVSLLRLWGEW